MIMQSQKEVDPEDVKKLDSLVAILDNPTNNLTFSFDPNTLSVDSLVLLGIPQKIAQRLVNYRSKGGKFRVKSDVKKIYGLNDDLYDRIEAYINLPDSISTQRVSILKIDINTATNVDLRQIDGVSPVMASRIVKYRSLLGGFIAKEQLAEVYQLEGMALKNVEHQIYIASSFQPEKIRINSASQEEIIQHPYITRQLAENIIRFRDINGAIESEKLLANFKSVDKGNFQKLILYLDFQ